MADATPTRSGDDVRITAAAAVTSGEVWQLPDGRAAYYGTSRAASSGDRVAFKASNQVVMSKTTGIVLLDGGRAYWDHSANAVHYKKVNDRDFYLGRVVGNAASADTTCTVNLNVDPPYDIDAARDPFLTAIVGTQALTGPILLRRGGAHEFVLSSTNEAQKVDLLTQDGFAVGANAIVEFCFNVVSDGSGTAVDVSLGVANGTHATDADSITEHLLIHLDANATPIKAQSKDGTTTVAATDTTKTYTEGSTVAERVEVWMDFRDPADVQVYVNGVNVLPATVFNVSAAAGPLRLLAHVEKTASTDTYDLLLGWMRARFSEQ